MTAPVLMGAALALVVSGIAFRFVTSEGGGGTAAGPVPTQHGGSERGAAPSELRGEWTGSAKTAEGATVTVLLRIRPHGGTLRRDGCRGSLRPFGTPGRDRAAFGYTERSRRQACPQETRVTVRLETEVLRLEETLEGVPYLSGRLRRAG